MAFLFSRAKPNGTSSLVQTAKSQLEQTIERPPGVQTPVSLAHETPLSNVTKYSSQKDDPASKTLGTIKAIIQGSYGNALQQRPSDLR